MAESGYCSECGENVELTPEGACPNGHGPECIDEAAGPAESPESPEAEAPAAEVPEVADEDALAPEADESAPQEVATSVPEPVTSSSQTTAPQVAPQRNRAGLVVVIAVILLLLAACVGAGLLLFPALQRAGITSGTKTTSTAHAKLATSVGFMEALLNNDTIAIKPFLTDAAQKAITQDQWEAIAAEATTGDATFTPPKYTDDTKAFVSFTNGDTTGTLTFTLDSAKPDDVMMVGASASASETDTVTLTAAGSGWRVAAISSAGGGTTTFDPAFVKSMAATDTAQ